jgi:hypothetical protein
MSTIMARQCPVIVRGTGTTSHLLDCARRHDLLISAASACSPKYRPRLP